MSDSVTMKRMEADIEEAIQKIIEKYCEEGAFWVTDNVTEEMAKSAMKVLTLTSESAVWGRKNI